MLLLKFDVIIIKYVWICLNKQGSEYAWGPKRATILNMAKFQGMNSQGGWGGLKISEKSLLVGEGRNFLFWWGSNFFFFFFYDNDIRKTLITE